MAAKSSYHGSEIPNQEDLESLSIEKLRKILKGKGLPTTGKKKILLERLVNFQYDSKPNIAKSALHEDSNYVEDFNKPLVGKKTDQLKEINAITRKAKVLQVDLDALIRDIEDLSQVANNKVKVQLRIERLIPYREKYLQLRDEMIALIEDDKIEEELSNLTELLALIDKAVDVAHEYLNKECKVEDRSSKQSTHNDSRQPSNLKLPTIELPKFNGDVLKFQNFWDQFEAAVHSSDDLPKVQKFTYLRSVLTGNALHTIEGFEVTGANYQAAVDCLKRYGRKRVIISSLVKSIIKMDAKSVVTASSLRDLYDTLMNRTRALEALGETPVSHGCILLPMFETKLPSQLLEKWELELAGTPEEEISLDLFFKFLNRQVVSKEAGEGGPRTNPGPNNRNFLKGRDERKKSVPTYTSSHERVSTASALFSEARVSTSPSCSFCKGNHDLPNCPEFNRKTVDERWRVVKESKLCCNCLRPTNRKHFSQICRQPKCSVANCGRRHHKLLHGPPLEATPQYLGSTTAQYCVSTTPQCLSSVTPHTQTNTTLSGLAAARPTPSMKETLLQTALARLSANGQEMMVRVLFDSGSQRSYIRKNIAESIGLQGPSELLSVTTLGGDTSETKRLQRVKFALLPVKGDSPEAVEMEALTIPKICNPLGPVKLDLQNNLHLQGLSLADVYPRNSVQVDVLIGADHYYSFVAGTCKKGKDPQSLIAVESHLGWILTGPVHSYSKHTTSMFTTVENSEVTASLRRFWELESIGITETENPIMSKEEEFAVKDFHEGLNFDGKNYEVQLPWKRDHPKLENNYRQAVKRLESVERKLRLDPQKAEVYSTAINQYVEKGFAEEVPDQSSEGVVRYLPHHAVFRPDKTTTKCRIVFDASAREKDSVSLNDCVLAGPALQPNLASVLIRFRTHRVGLLADVEKMFLQVKMAPKDRDVHRYLWRDLRSDETPKVYRMQRLTFGVNSSPFLAIATVHAHVRGYAETFPCAVREILDNMYLDDCLTGADTDSSALKLRQEMSDIMIAGAFNLTKWASNSETVMDSIDPAKRASSSLVEFDSSEPLKALGVSWDLTSDCFRFIAPKSTIASHDPMTKRSLLSLASKTFDPMGLISPFTVRAKILFQELWRRGLEWDDPVDSDIGRDWSSWKTESLELKDVAIPRCFGNGIASESVVELHGFGDASPKAYGAAVNLRITDSCGHVATQLVMSKSRVAPIKAVSLPRLELLVAVVNARLLKFVVRALPVKMDRVVCWTDSMVTRHWIRRPSSHWKPFVANRVAEIQSTWDPQCWRYVPSKENPADLLTRGLNCDEMISSTLWWNGPHWLPLPPECWPVQPQDKDALSQVREEERRMTHSCTAVTVKPLIDMSRYGTWLKLIRVTAYVLRAVMMFKTGCKAKLNELSAEELKQAELKCYMWIQEEAYKEDLKQLKIGGTLPNNSRLLKLDPYYDAADQVIRVGGRLQFAKDLLEESKHQIILPHGHPAVARMVRHVHQQMLHAGPETILSVLRQRVWLTQGRREVKRIIRKCVPCQKQRVGPCVQKMGPLPEERASSSPAFMHIGTDFAGPLYVKESSGTKKTYICIFTCASTRMVHLELTNTLTTDEFLQAFSRMTSRRGLCNTVWSDNAKTFKAASKEIKKKYDQPKTQSQLIWDTLDQDRIKSEFASKGIKWKFITERSPWRGGWWERFCRAVKEPLHKVLGRALLTFTELNTLLVRIEGIINSRPLTAVSDDNRDPLPITPAHLAIGRPLNHLPDAQEDFLEESSKKIMERFLYLQRLLNHYWERWKHEYLHQLSVRNKWQKEESPIQVGDIVLVSEDNVSRGKWPLAVVEDTHRGKDGLVRTATVRTQRGAFNRPVQRLHRLELESVAPQVISREEVSVHGGEELKSDVVHVQSVPVSKPIQDIVLPDEGQGGEDVTARTRSGRTVRKPKKLDI